ncbi:hypothetical protein [Granulicella arctica]|uniref:Uncharacterized protein n=1 Tax=Granulicella arctica TaxID=940613 RepID=A0A7Y9TGM3_9BACT|nr:hypothetical protein [Granulicella arctica]NYF78910.1 hypothetical protein [Granulicella arctica]
MDLSLLPAANLSQLSVIDVITALGALGTASFGLVDTTKAAGGGVSRVGMGDIKKALAPLFGGNPSPTDRSTPLTYASVLDNLRANWMNGTVLADQKAIAKTLIKLRLTAATSAQLAAATGVDPDELAVIATKINTGVALSPAEADTFGRFDLALTSLFDQAYQRADQRYRNAAKILAGAFSVAIAFVAGFLYSHPGNGGAFSKLCAYVQHPFAWEAILAGALATPIAPVAKDLTSAIAAGTNLVQKMSKP